MPRAIDFQSSGLSSIADDTADYPRTDHEQHGIPQARLL